jgi:L-aspartate oxidase
MICKTEPEESDSFLAQGGICVLRNQEDFDAFFEDTMKAGHYDNNKEAVTIMINSSREVITDLINFGVDFEHKGNEYLFTREGAHTSSRIMYHKDRTGYEITSTLLELCKKQDNIDIRPDTLMTDLIIEDDACHGIQAQSKEGDELWFFAEHVILATGGVGGLFENSTNFRHLTGDAIAIAQRNGIDVKNVDRVQIHPTSLYDEKPDRRFLISESVRGEGAILLDKNLERFTNELLPRDLLTAEIKKQMEKDGTKHVWLDMRTLEEFYITERFQSFYESCLEHGIDITKDLVPVVPAQHYYMGGIASDMHGRTSLQGLYAVGETSDNGVHGKNRLASNSLLEGLVFAKRAAADIDGIEE